MGPDDLDTQDHDTQDQSGFDDGFSDSLAEAA